jgi:hypothetical protein
MSDYQPEIQYRHSSASIKAQSAGNDEFSANADFGGVGHKAASKLVLDAGDRQKPRKAKAAQVQRRPWYASRVTWRSERMVSPTLSHSTLAGSGAFGGHKTISAKPSQGFASEPAKSPAVDDERKRPRFLR